MKKRIGLIVIAACALLSVSLASKSTVAWWNEPGPNHLTPDTPTWSHHSHPHSVTAQDDAEIQPAWWNENGPNH